VSQQPSSRMCFVCGRDNPVGLKLSFFEEPETQRVRADFVVPAAYQGYPGIVHGGIVSTILDEVSGRAVMMASGGERLFATVKLTVRFHRPTPTESPLSAYGWVEKESGVGAKVAGEIQLPDGTVTAYCKSVLVDPPAAFKETWGDEKAFWRVEGE